jgi:predicted O-methyltransferase YrrM
MKSSARRILRSLQAVSGHLRRPPWVRPGHFYSPSTGLEDVNRALSWTDEAPGVNLRQREQLDLVRQLAPLLAETPQDRYSPDNPMFGIADAAILYAMLCHLQPRRVIEIGSGFSTAMLMDTAEHRAFDIDITCIEPYPDRLLKVLKSTDEITLIRKPVQDVPLSSYVKLKSNDLLFIDSTHVAKAGSDVLWLFLRVLPQLAPGVAVHVHDIFWPFEYPERWLREGRYWTESYFLNAFLCQNSSWDVLLFSSWIWETHARVVPLDIRSSHPGSFWMQRRDA